MAMGREGDRQGDLIVTWREMPRSPGHVFYDRLQEVLIAGGFDLFCRDDVPALLRAEDGRAVVAAGALLPHAHGWLFRGDRQRARHCLAVFGFDVAARFPAAGEPRGGSRSFVAVKDTRAASPCGSPEGLPLGA